MKKIVIPQPKQSTRVLLIGAASTLFWLAVFASAGALIGFAMGMGYISEWFAGFFTAIVALVSVFVCERVYRVTGVMYEYALSVEDYWERS